MTKTKMTEKKVVQIDEKALHLSWRVYRAQGLVDEEWPDGAGNTNPVRTIGPRYLGAFRVTRPQDVNLGAKGGFALGDNWVKWGETVAVEPGSVITGKDKKDNDWFAVVVLEDGSTRVVTNTDIERAIQALSDPEKVAKAKNSQAYAYAVYAWWLGQQAAQAQDEAPEGAEPGVGVSEEAMELARRLVELAGPAGAKEALALAISEHLAGEAA